MTAQPSRFTYQDVEYEIPCAWAKDDCVRLPDGRYLKMRDGQIHQVKFFVAPAAYHQAKVVVDESAE